MKQYISENELHKFENEVLINYDKKSNPLMQVLQESQSQFGCVPIEMQEIVGKYFHISTAKINGVVSFYSMFSLTPNGKNTIGVCMGTACYVKGADRLLDRVREELGIEYGETTKDGNFTLAPTRCVGDCSSAPVIMVNDKIFKKVTSDDIKGIINEFK